MPGADLMVIKPSGVAYDELTPENMVVTRPRRRRLVEGDARAVVATPPRTPTSTAHMPEVGGVVHTHSTYATAWAARGEPIPCVLTMMADEFGGEIPVGPFALIGDDSIGRGIVETLQRPPLAGRADAPTTARSPSAATRRAAVKAAVHVRGRRPHRAHRPPARRAAARSPRQTIDAPLRPLPERLRADTLTEGRTAA